LKIIDRIEPLPQLFYKKWWNSLIQLLSTKTWQILALLFIWISLISKLIKQVNNSKKECFSRFFITLALVLLFITHSSFQENYTKKEAVIFTETVIVNSAPTSNSTNLFPLHSGTKVVIIDIIGNWINIKIANGNSGWIKQIDSKEL
jgi:hypothetical protein